MGNFLEFTELPSRRATARRVSVCVWPVPEPPRREMSSKEITSGSQNREKVTHHHTIGQTQLNVCF